MSFVPYTVLTAEALNAAFAEKADLVGGKVPISQIPDSVIGALDYKGTWDASTNTPAIPAAALANKGHYYVVNVAGTTSVDGESDWNLGDWIISNGTAWGKVDNSDKVSSVNGKAGVVTLVPTDIGAEPERTLASQAEMEAATEAGVRAMSPVRVKDAVVKHRCAIGDILWSSLPSVPGTYLRCDGSAYLQSAYPELFSKVGLLNDYSSGNLFGLRVSGFGANIVNGVTYGGGMFVAFGGNGTLSSSPDGITWTARTSQFGTNAINGITYGGGMFVAFGAGGKLSSSPDGITWTTMASQFGTTGINYGAYGNGMFVVVVGTNTVSSSPDGINWTSRSSGFGTTAGIRGLAFIGGMFVAFGDSGNLSTSSDGITWTARTSQFGTTAITGVTYGGGMFVAFGGYGTLSSSPDGINWTARTSQFGTTAITGVTYGGGMFVAFGGTGILSSSPDGITWTARSSNITSAAINGVTYANGMFVAFGNSGNLSTSTSGIIWTKRSGSWTVGDNISAVVFGRGLFLVLTGGLVHTSPDLLFWTQQYQFSAVGAKALFLQGLFIVHATGGFLISGNGLWYNTATHFVVPRISAALENNGYQPWIRAR